jgi:dihydroorotate dehydrogenase (NAD+) catalytic subunit
MVYECANAVNIPIIGMGGICTWEDAVEMMLAGATAVSIGTANFFNPTATIDVLQGVKDYMERKNIKDINEIIGIVK